MGVSHGHFLKYVFLFEMQESKWRKRGYIRQEKHRKGLALDKKASELRIPLHSFLEKILSTFLGAVTFSPSVVLFDSAPLDSSVYSCGNQVSG